MKYYTTKAYRSLLLFGAMFAMAACADIDFGDDDFVRKPMSFMAGRSFDPTRAATTNVQDDLFDAGEEINVFIQGSVDRGATWVEPILDHESEAIGTPARPAVFVTSAFNGSVNTLSPKTTSAQPYYPMNPIEGGTADVKAKIFAAYPTSVTPLTPTFTVQYDQSTDRGYKNSDLMLVTPFEHAKNNQVINLPFKHKMTKLIVTAIPDGNVTIDPEITIGSIMRSVDVDVANGDFAYSATAPTTIPLSDENADDYKQRKIKILNGGAVVFPPQWLEAGPEFIMITGKVKENDQWVERTSQFDILDKTFKEGRVYKLNLHIGENDFEINPNDNNHHISTITGWSEDYDELTVTPSGGYSGVTIAAINGNVTDADIPHTEAGNYIFTGEPRCPTPTVTYGDPPNQKTLVEGTDFRYVYVDNVNAGNNAQVMVIGMGAYAGLAALKPFTIERAKAKISFPEGSDKIGENAVAFNPDENIGFVKAINTGDGNVIYSVVADGDDESTDCASVDPIDGTVIVQNVGKCTIKATATAGRNYDYPEPDNTCTYKIHINPKEVKVGNLTVTYAPTEFTFDDTDKKLTKLVVADGEHTLVEDVDYTYTFTNIRHHGNAKLTITGKGNYNANTKIEINIPINQAKPTITVKETELALGIQSSTAPKTRKKTREATTEDWAKNKLRFSLSPTEDVKSNEYLTVNNNGLLTGLKVKEDSQGNILPITVYVSIDADDSDNHDWIAAEQKLFDVKVYPSDFTFRIKRYTYDDYREPQVHIMEDGIPEGAHTRWVCPAKGEWQIDCYGAQGGTTPRYTTERRNHYRKTTTAAGPAITGGDNAVYNNQGNGGRGAHIAGRIKLPKNQVLHVNLGQKGRVVYPGEQRVRWLTKPSGDATYLRDNNRGSNGGKKNGDVSTVKAGDYEWAGFAWNGGGGLVWGAHNMYQHPMYYDQDNTWVGCTYNTQRSPAAVSVEAFEQSSYGNFATQMGQSYNMFPMPSGGGATDVSLAWDEEDGRYKPHSENVTIEDERNLPGYTDVQKNDTKGWSYAHNMVNREYGVGCPGDEGVSDANRMVGLQWKNPAHLFSRIIVAGGGGGGLYYDSSNSFGDGGDGGAWEGKRGLFNDFGTGGYLNEAGRGGAPYYNWKVAPLGIYGSQNRITREDNRTQEYNATGTGTTYPNDIVYVDGPIGGSWSCTDGMFGEGGNTFQPAQGCGGGGGGWYGGGGGGESGQNGTGGGGSSFMWTDQVTIQPFVSATNSRGAAVAMYKFYDTIDSDYQNYNGWAPSSGAYNSYWGEWHKKASNFYKFMPTNSIAKQSRGSTRGIECPFFHEVVTKDAGANAGDGWAKITLVEIDDDQ